MNQCIIVGRLTRDPETRTTQSGKNVCTFTVAVDKRNRDQGADFFRVAAWEKLADICQKHLAKGRQVAISGSISANAYLSKQDGTPRASLELSATSVEFCGGKPESSDAPAQDSGYTEINDDDLPF